MDISRIFITPRRESEVAVDELLTALMVHVYCITSRRFYRNLKRRYCNYPANILSSAFLH